MNTRGILDTSNLEASVFFLMGGLKTVRDYKSTPEGHKRDILLNDVVVLSASSAGMLGYRGLAQKFKPPKGIIHETLSNVSMVASGLFGAILGDFILTKTGHGIHKVKKMQQKRETPFTQMERKMKTNVDAVVTRDVRREMMNRMTDMPAFSMFTTSMVGLQGLEITDSDKTSKQVKNATKYLMVNSLVPLFFLSCASSMTKRLKNIYRLPIMFFSLVGGTFAVKKAVDFRVNK